MPRCDTCPVCQGELLFMGALGQRNHFRCRDCGAECSVLVDGYQVQTKGKRK